jgi:hypothetical protein
MEKAQKLMFEHDLKMYEIGEDTGNGSGVTHTEIFVDGKTMQWKGMLLHYISIPFNCKVVYVRTAKNVTRWTLIGTPDNIKAVEVLWEALVPWLKSQSTIARRASMPSNPNAFNRAFYDRAGRRIHTRLQEQRDYLEHAHTKGTDLVLARDAQNDRYAQDLFTNVRETRRRGLSNVEGMVHGDKAGREADITSGKLGQ